MKNNQSKANCEQDTHVIRTYTNVIKSGSIFDAKFLHKEDEARQQPISENNNYFVDMCVQYLKLTEQTNEKGDQVLIDFQDNKFETEIFDDGVDKFCYLK
jgi:hypothetical protein